MPVVGRFDTPGSLRDAPEGSGLYDNWHRRVARLLKARTRVTRDARSRITKVTFVTETPEYWEALAETEPALLVERYGDRARFIDLGSRRITLEKEWVIPTGGGYFFAPPVGAISDVLGG